VSLKEPVTLDFKLFKILLNQAKESAADTNGSVETTAATQAPAARLTAGQVEQLAQLAHKVSGPLPVAKILWADDHPLNNQFERMAFASLGIYCDSYTNNADALSALQSVLRARQLLQAADDRPYDVIISDYHRDNEKVGGVPQTGADLLKAVRSIDLYRTTPFFFYTAGGVDAVRDVAVEYNATATNDTSVLVSGVINALPRRAQSGNPITRFWYSLTRQRR
jgi:hypothetical protein